MKPTCARRRGIAGLWCIMLLCLAVASLPAVAAQGAADAITFDGVRFEHRWSQGGQNEYTPAGQENLQAWVDMVTINVHPQVTDGEALAGLANTVLGNYQRIGTIVRTDSVPATAAQPAEHLVVALLAGNGVVEAAFARFILRDGVGYVVVRSRRAYGEDPGTEAVAWLQANAAAQEAALMRWHQLPPLPALQALGQ